MIITKNNGLKFFGFLLIGLGLRSVISYAPTPEKSQNLWFALPAFFVFVQFLIGMCSWGAFFRSKITGPFFSKSEEAFFDLAAGTASAYILAYALTPLGLFSASKGVFLWIVLASGFALGSNTLQYKAWFDFQQKTFGKILMAILPLMVIVKCVEGIQFHQHGDAYVTYLVGPRTWAVNGNFQDFLKFSQLFLSTSWESLFAWGTALMGFHGGAGLDISQWFSQWTSGAIGVLGVLLASLAFCKRIAAKFPLDSIWFPAIAISAVQVPGLRWTQNLAKNDMGIIFWGMSAFYFSIYCASVSPALAFFAGVFTGAAVVGKFTVLILGVLISLSVILNARKNCIPFILGGLTGSLPVLLRNLILTKNPVFPWLPKLFPSPYLSDLAEHGASAAMAKNFQFSNLPEYLLEMRAEIPLVFSLLIFFFIFKERKLLLQSILLPLISFAVFTYALRPSTGIRYQNATLVLLTLYAAFFTFVIASRITEKFAPKAKQFALALVAIVIVASANITFFTLFQIGNGNKFCTYSKRMVNTNQIGGPAKVWIRSNISNDHSILSFGDVHIYYLIDYPLTEVGQSVEYGKKVSHASLDEVEKMFKSAPFDYLYLAGEDYYKDDAFSKDQAQISDIMNRAQSWNPACKKFDNTKAQVWDLRCLNGST